MATIIPLMLQVPYCAGKFRAAGPGGWGRAGQAWPSSRGGPVNGLPRGTTVHNQTRKLSGHRHHPQSFLNHGSRGLERPPCSHPGSTRESLSPTDAKLSRHFSVLTRRSESCAASVPLVRATEDKAWTLVVCVSPRAWAHVELPCPCHPKDGPGKMAQPVGKGSMLGITSTGTASSPLPSQRCCFSTFPMRGCVCAYVCACVGVCDGQDYVLQEEPNSQARGEHIQLPQARGGEWPTAPGAVPSLSLV